MKLLIFVIVIFAVVAAITGGKKGNRRRKRSRSFKEPASYGWTRESEPVSGRLNDFLATGNERADEAQSPYRDKFRLLNNTEMALYLRLVEAVPAMLIFSQVSMSQIFHIRGFTQLNEVGKKSVDFLICRRSDSSIVAALEFNGPTHMGEKQKLSDEKKRAALEEAGIPLLVITEVPLPNVTTLRRMLAPHIIERKKYETERDKRLKRRPSA